MNGISASIVVLSGSVALLAGALAEGHHGELPSFIGVILILFGLLGWVLSLGKKKD